MYPAALILPSSFHYPILNQLQNDAGRTALWEAAYHGHADVAALLITVGEEVGVNQASNSGSTPLLVAAQMGHTVIAVLLVTEGHADPNQAKDDGQTPLSKAAQKGHTGIVKLLLDPEHGAKPNQPMVRANHNCRSSWCTHYAPS